MSFLYLTALFLIFFALRTQTVRVAQKIKSRLVRYKKSYALRTVELCARFPVSFVGKSAEKELSPRIGLRHCF